MASAVAESVSEMVEKFRVEQAILKFQAESVIVEEDVSLMVNEEYQSDNLHDVAKNVRPMIESDDPA